MPKQHGKASFTQVEIKDDCVCIIDNSKQPFNIFNPPENSMIIEKGGAITAKKFAEKFSLYFEYYNEQMGELIYQRFIFHNCIMIEPCKIIIKDRSLLRRRVNKFQFFDIPLICKKFTLDVPIGYLDLSTISQLLLTALKYAKIKDISIIIHIEEEDLLKSEFIKVLNTLDTAFPQDYLPNFEKYRDYISII